MLKLVIEDDEGKQTVVPLIRDEITIGRKEGNTIRLTERNVSRRHARLVKQNGAVFIEDLGSYNGIKLNGIKIAARTPIGEGDQVLIGDYRLSVKFDRPAVAATPGAPSPALRATSMGLAPTPGAPVPAAETPTTPLATRPLQPAMAIPQPPAAPVAPAPIAFQPPPPIAAPPPTPLPAPSPFSTGAPSAQLDASPTIPVRTLSGQDLAPGVSAGPPPRLVVMSTELAGSEFVLDRASHVVGRTEENDVMLNHRSISRHHAKIVRDGDRTTIVDLQSANGVRVNGEEYERIELHPGDVIELGHVKLRFVGAHEPFVFDPSMVLAAGPRFPPKTIALAVGGGVVIVGVLVLLLQGGETPKSKLVEATPAGSKPAPTVVTTPPAEPTKAAPPSGATPAELMTKAQAAAKDENWDEALAALAELVGKEPGDDKAQALKQKVEVEKGNAEHFARFKQQSDGKNWDDALQAYAEITEDSVYKDKGKVAFQQARGKFIDQHLESAEKLRGQGKCAEVQKEAGMVLTVDERNKLAREVVRLCKPRGEAVAVASKEPKPEARPAREHHAKPEPAPKAAVASAPRPAPAPTRAEEPAGDPQALVKQAREAWVRGQHAAAIEAARKALKAKPGYTDAYLIIAVASCSLRDADGAARAYGKLEDKMKGMVRSSCQKNGITLE